MSSSESSIIIISNLLVELFDANDVRQFLHKLPGGEKITRSLPNPPASDREMAYAAAEYLVRNGLLREEFFQQLIEERPKRTADIENEQRRYQDSLVEPSGLSSFFMTDFGPGRYVENSRRLNKAVQQLQKAIQQGHRLIALRGRPGDGKSEVARQLADKEGALYLELSSRLDAEESWLNLLRELIGWQNNKENSDSSALIPKVRSVLKRMNHPGIVIDNADRPLLGVEHLLASDSRKWCVLVGPGVRDVDKEVTLKAPSVTDFIQIVFRGRVPPEEKKELLKTIGELSDHSAIVARLISPDADSPTFKLDLEGWVEALREGISNQHHDQIYKAIQKAWRSLDPVNQRRLLFLIAVGETNVPIEWYPASLSGAAQSSWSSLSRTGLALVTQEGTISVHRMIARWAGQQASLDVADELLECVRDWSTSFHLRDELKAGGRRTRAFRNSVRYLASKPTSREQLFEQPEILKRYLDYVTHSMLPLEIQSHLKSLFPAAADIDGVSPMILGVLLDSLRVQSESDYLRQIQDSAQRQLQALAASRLESAESSHLELAEASGLHHLGKYLSRQHEAEVQLHGFAILRTIAHIAEDAARGTSGVDHWRWREQAASTTIQILQDDSLSATERIQQAMRVLGTDYSIPRYLKLGLIRRLFHNHLWNCLAPFEQETLLREGLLLCNSLTILGEQARFLYDLFSLYPSAETRSSIHQIAKEFFHRVELDTLQTQQNDTEIGQALLKIGGDGIDSVSFTYIGKAFELWSRRYLSEERPQPYLSTRIGAALRELGWPEIASSFLEQRLRLQTNEKGIFFNQFEHIKALRWQGDYAEALRRLQKLKERNDRAGSLCDEQAKCLVCLERIEEAQQALLEGIERYNREGLPWFAEQGGRWIELLKSDLDKGKELLLEDHYRCLARKRAAPEEYIDYIKIKIDAFVQAAK